MELRNEEIKEKRRRLLGIVNATANLASRGFFLGGILLHIMISPLLFMSLSSDEWMDAFIFIMNESINLYFYETCFIFRWPALHLHPLRLSPPPHPSVTLPPPNHNPFPSSVQRVHTPNKQTHFPMRQCSSTSLLAGSEARCSVVVSGRGSSICQAV